MSNKFVKIDNYQIGAVLEDGSIRSIVTIKDALTPENTCVDQTRLRDRLVVLMNKNGDFHV